MIAERYTY